MKRGKWLSLLLRGLASALLIGWLVGLVDWADFFDRLKRCNLWLIVVVQICLFLFPCLSAVKWQRLLVIRDARFSLWHLTRSYFIAGFFNNFFPTTIGGDVVRVLHTMPAEQGPVEDSRGRAESAHQREGLETAVAAVLVERITGFIALIGICYVAAALNLLLGEQHAVFRWVFVGGSASLVSLAPAMFSIRWLRRSDRWRRVHIPRFLVNVARSTTTYPLWGVQFRPVWLLSFVFQGSFVLAAAIMTEAIGIDISLRSLFVIVPLRALIMMLPVSLNGFGLSEAAYVVLFSGFGVPAEEGLLMGVIQRVLVVQVGVFGGVLYALGGENFRLDAIRRKRSGSLPGES